MDNGISNKMDIIIIADDRGEGLLPLTQYTCSALLPICGKPMLEHVLESLIPLSVSNVTLLVNGFSGQVRQFAGGGERWGVDVSYRTTRGNSSFTDVVSKRDRDNQVPCLVLDTGILRAFDIGDAIEQFRSQGSWLSSGMFGGKETGVHYIDPKNRALDQVASEASVFVNLAMDYCEDVSLLKKYHACNLRLAHDKPERVLTRGTQKHPGIFAGPGCQIKADNIDGGELFAGERCRLESNVVCKGTVVLGDNVVVDRNTTIVNSLILDNTFVGEHLYLENAIVWRNILIRVDKETSITLEDDRLLGSLSSSVFSVKVGSFIGRLTALMVLLLSLPLWLVALVDASFGHGLSMCKRVRYLGNAVHSNLSHRQFSSFEIKTRYQALVKLPLMLEIARGNIDWFGVSVLAPEDLDGRTESWQFMRDECPVGLIGPAQIELDEESSIDEILMADATRPGCKRSDLFYRYLKKLVGLNYDVVPQQKMSSR